jgi:hypothetical protein
VAHKPAHTMSHKLHVSTHFPLTTITRLNRVCHISGQAAITMQVSLAACQCTSSSNNSGSKNRLILCGAHVNAPRPTYKSISIIVSLRNYCVFNMQCSQLFAHSHTHADEAAESDIKLPFCHACIHLISTLRICVCFLNNLTLSLVIHDDDDDEIILVSMMTLETRFIHARAII